MELYTGELLFQTHDSGEHLALMEQILGPFPLEMVGGGGGGGYGGYGGGSGGGGAGARGGQSKEVRKYFDSAGRMRFPDKFPRESVRHVRSQRKLSELVNVRDTVFLDLVRQMLTLDPAQRLTARAALNHRFFTSVRKALDVPRPTFAPRGGEQQPPPPPPQAPQPPQRAPPPALPP